MNFTEFLRTPILRKICKQLLQSQTKIKTTRCFDRQTKTTKVEHDLIKTFGRLTEREKKIQAALVWNFFFSKSIAFDLTNLLSEILTGKIQFYDLLINHQI